MKAAAWLQKTKKYEWRWVRGWFCPDLKQNLAMGIVWVFLFSGIEISGFFYPCGGTFWWKTRLSGLKNLWLRVAEPRFEQGWGATRQLVNSAISNICNELFLHPVLIKELCKNPVREKGG